MAYDEEKPAFHGHGRKGDPDNTGRLVAVEQDLQAVKRTEADHFNQLLSAVGGLQEDFSKLLDRFSERGKVSWSLITKLVFGALTIVISVATLSVMITLVIGALAIRPAEQAIQHNHDGLVQVDARLDPIELTGMANAMAIAYTQGWLEGEFDFPATYKSVAVD